MNEIVNTEERIPFRQYCALTGHCRTEDEPTLDVLGSMETYTNGSLLWIQYDGDDK